MRVIRQMVNAIRCFFGFHDYETTDSRIQTTNDVPMNWAISLNRKCRRCDRRDRLYTDSQSRFLS